MIGGQIHARVALYRRFLDVVAPLIAGLTPFLWFHSPYIANGNDTSWPFNGYEWFVSRLYMWYPRDNGGVNGGANVAGVFWHGTQALVQRLPGSNTFHEQLFLAFWYTITAISIWTAARLITRQMLPAVVAMLVYLFNPVIVTGALFENASVSNIAVYAVLPSLVTVLLFTLQRRINVWFGAAIFALLSLIASPVGMFPPLQVALMLFLATFVVIHWLTTDEPGASRRTLLIVASFTLAYIATNMYWILPLANFLQNTAGEAGGASLSDFNYPDWEAGQSSHSALFVVARMLGSWDWFYQYNGEWFVSYAIRYLYNPIFVFIGAALVALAFITVRLSARGIARNQSLMLAAAGILILLFAPGSHPVTGAFFTLFRRVVPGMEVIRSPWFVFTQFLPLVYGLLLALLIASLRGTKRRIAVVLLSTATVIYGFPIFTGEFLKPFREQIPGFVMKYPSYVIDAARYLASRPGRETFLPAFSLSPSIFPWEDGPIISSSPVTAFLHMRPNAYFLPAGATLLSRRPYDLMLQRAYRDILDESEVAASDLMALGITDIVVQNDAWFDLGGGYQISPETWENAVRHIPGVRLARMFGPWHVYELPYRGRITATSAASIGNLRPDMTGTWSAVRGPNQALLTVNSNVLYPESMSRWSDFALDENAPRAADIARFWSAHQERTLSTFVDARGSRTVQDPLTHPRVSASLVAHALGRQQTQPIFSLVDPRTDDLARTAVVPSIDRALDVDRVSVSVATLAALETQSILMVDSGSPLSLRISIRLNGSEPSPDTTATGFISWSARLKVLTVMVRPGLTSFGITHGPGDVEAIISSVSSDDQQPPVVGGDVSITPAAHGMTVIMHSKRQPGWSALGVSIPLIRDIPVDSAPVISSDVRYTVSTGAYAAIVADIRRPDGATSREEFAVSSQTPVDLIKRIDARYRQRWAFRRASHESDQEWLLAHRIPPRVEGSMVTISLMLIGGAGDNDVRFDVQSVSIVADNSYEPTTALQSYSLDTPTADWSGQGVGIALPLSNLNGAVRIGPLPASQFADYMQSRNAGLILHERYLFTTNINEHLAGEVISSGKDFVTIQLANDTVRTLQKTSISAVDVPLDGGVLTASLDVDPIIIAERVVTLTYSPVVPQQRIFPRLTLRSGSRTFVIDIDPYRPDSRLLGATVNFMPDMAVLSNGTHIIRRTLGLQDLSEGPPSKTVLIDGAQLIAAQKLPRDTRLVHVSLLASWASSGLLVGRVTVFHPASTFDAPGGAAPSTTIYGATAEARSGAVETSAISVSPVRYDLRMSPERPTVLALDEEFNAGWKAVLAPHVEHAGGILAWTGLQYAFAPSLPHFPVNGYENGFLVPPGRNVDVVLLYAPQSWYAIGVALSLLDTLAMVVVAIATRRRMQV